VSTSGTGEESTRADAGNNAGNGTYSGRIVLEVVTRCYGEKWNRLEEHDICGHKIFLGGGIIILVSLWF